MKNEWGGATTVAMGGTAKRRKGYWDSNNEAHRATYEVSEAGGPKSHRPSSAHKHRAQNCKSCLNQANEHQFPRALPARHQTRLTSAQRPSNPRRPEPAHRPANPHPISRSPLLVFDREKRTTSKPSWTSFPALEIAPRPPPAGIVDNPLETCRLTRRWPSRRVPPVQPSEEGVARA